MTGPIDDPRALISGFTPPVFPLVYPGKSSESESRAEWTRIADELEDQEKKENEEKKEKDKDESNDKRDSTSSDVKLYRVDHIIDQEDEDGGSPVRFLFPISTEQMRSEQSYTDPSPGTVLESKVADEIDSLYRLYGTKELGRFRQGVDDAYLRNLKALNDDYADGTREEEEKFGLRTDLLAAARMVESIVQRQLRALGDRIKEHQEKVTKAAAKLASAKLEEAGDEILAEAKRYLPFARHSVNAQAALETSNVDAFLAGGPDSRDLREALARINSRMKTLDNPPPAEPGFFAPVNPLATSPAEDAAHALEYEVSLACQRYPVLHRSWKSLAFTRYADTEREIFSTLSGAWISNRRIRDTLANKPDIVWLFPTLIHETLETMAVENADYGDLGTGARAAQERLEAQQKERTTASLAKFVGLLDLAVAFTSPAPPVALAIAGASVVLSLTDSTFEYEELSAQADAASGTLDPSKALSACPGFGFFALGIALSLLDLRSMRNAYKAARVTREVDDMSKVVTEAI